MKIVLRLPVFIIIWLVFLIFIKLPVNFIGLFVVPFMWKYRNVDYNKLPWWTRLWSNLEDWQGQINHYQSSLPKWWVLAHGTDFKSFWLYHAWRNGGDGLRSIEWLDLDMDPKKVEYWTSEYFARYEPVVLRGWELKTVGYLAWQGWQAGMKFIHIWPDKKRDLKIWKWTLIKAGPKHFVMKWGWRVEPSDAVNPHRTEILTDDASFASKFLPYRNG